MSKAVLLSTQPKWCEKICNKIGENKDGSPIYEKRVEVRKTKPKIETPFKVYIYCTLQGSNEFFQALKNSLGEYEALSKWNRENWGLKKGKVIGEFVCDFIRTEKEVACGLADAILVNASCVDAKDLIRYANGKFLYSWHISNLVIYDEPKELSEFHNFCETYPCCDESCEYYSWTVEGGTECMCDTEKPFKRPPQSWRYVEKFSERINTYSL